MSNDDLIEIVDDEDTPLGAMPRSEVHERGIRHRSVHIIVLNSRGELLVHKRTPTKDSYPGFWDVSAGGHVSPEESYEHAAVREMQEELGIAAPLEYLTKIEASEHTNWEFVSVYRCLYDGPINFDKEEIEECEFISPRILAREIAKGRRTATPALIRYVTHFEYIQHPEKITRERMNLEHAALPCMVYRLTTRLSRMILFAMMLIVPLVFPLKLSDSVIVGLEDFMNERGLFEFWDYQIEPVIFFGFSPLLLKEVFAGALMVLFILTHLCSRIFEPGWRTVSTMSFTRRFLHVPLICFLLYSGLSLLYSPTFFYSLQTFVRVALVLCFMLALFDMKKDRSLVNRLAFLYLSVCVVLCVLSIGQHLNLTNNFMLKYPDLRNRMGSLIGHNTGLSSFLMPAIFITIAIYMNAASRAARRFSLAILLLLGFVVVSAQSRGVWAVLILTLPVYIYVILRAREKKVPIRATLIVCLVILFLLASQTIQNPLRSEDAPLGRRLNELSLEHLKTETRLRIAVVSLPLILERPLFGHGLGSFQYVYPEAQAEYFSSHPNPFVTPTTKRTQRAHNDYLQLIIELGLLGFILVGLGVYIYVSAGLRTLKATRHREDRIYQTALLFSLFALLGHAVFDFPLHVMPIAFIACVVMVIWASGKNIWRQEESQEETDSAVTQNASISQLHTRASAPNIIVSIALSLLALCAAPLIFGFFYREYVKDVYARKGESYLNTFFIASEMVNPSVRGTLLRKAERNLAEAHRISPLDREVLFRWGQTLTTLGSFTIELSKQEKDKGDRQTAQYYAARAQSYYTSAIEKLDSALDEFRFHMSLFQKALAHKYLARFTDMEYNLRTYRELTEESARFTIAHGPILQELIKILRNDPSVDKAHINYLQKLIAKYDPDFFHEYYEKPLYTAVLNFEYNNAVRLAKGLIAINPEEKMYFTMLFDIYMKMGEVDNARMIHTLMKQHFSNSIEISVQTLKFLITQGRYADALLLCDKLLETEEIHSLKWIQVLLNEKLGKTWNVRTLLEKYTRHDEHAALWELGMVAINVFNDLDMAVPYFERRITLDPPPYPRCFYFLAQHYLKKRNYLKALDLIETCLYYDTKDPVAKKLHTRIVRIMERITSQASSTST